jgi:hypothetical protein
VRALVDQPLGHIEPAAEHSGNENASGVYMRGETALHLACSTSTSFHANHARIARTLLCAGADPNRPRSDGRTAVHISAASGNVSVLKELVRSGRVLPATWDARDSEGNAPRDLATGDAAALLAQLHGDDKGRSEGGATDRQTSQGDKAGLIHWFMDCD